jgi:hypothetical protein
VPAASPDVLTAAVKSAGAEPLAGETVSQEASSLAVKLNAPPPLLVTEIVLDAGLAPPAVPVNASDVGETASAGGGGGPGGTPITYADSGPSLQTCPRAQVAGRADSVPLALPCSGPPLPPARSCQRSTPVASLGLSSAIQYGVPAVNVGPPLMATSFQAPACGLLMRPLARSAAGWPPLSAYRPSTTALAVLAGATLSAIEVTRELAVAVVR